jgi:hypothetical membrane protein
MLYSIGAIVNPPPLPSSRRPIWRYGRRVIKSYPSRPSFNWRLLGGAVAPILFVATFTALGRHRPGYDWRRDAVSSLAVPPGGTPQRFNFIVTGLLLTAAGDELRHRRAIPRGAAWLTQGAGVGLLGSGVWVTDAIAGEPAHPAFTRASHLHNISALPIFLGIPVAALISSVSAARERAWLWSAISGAAGILMPGFFICFGLSTGPAPALAGKGGIFQRLSIGAGFGWVGGACIRAVQASRR